MFSHIGYKSDVMMSSSCELLIFTISSQYLFFILFTFLFICTKMKLMFYVNDEYEMKLKLSHSFSLLLGCQLERFIANGEKKKKI